jgi:c-di-GMP-binding flagellar brake protein YcgR
VTAYYHKYSGNDRRRYHRLDMDIEVFYRVAEPMVVLMTVGDKEVEATMLNLSPGGMAIETQYDIPQWTLLEIKFTLIRMDKDGKITFHRPVQLRGDVRSNVCLRDNEYRLGICFTKVSDKDKLEIDNFLEGR